MLFRQGATVATAVTVQASGTTTVEIFDLGTLKVGDEVSLGLGDGLFEVESLSGSELTVTLSNSTGTPIHLPAGTRLVPDDDRPVAFLDPRGTSPMPGGSELVPDERGRVQAYISERRFDYVVSKMPILIGTASTTTLNAATSTLTWYHTVSDGDSMVVVALAWQDALGEESLDSVTLGGQAMTRIGGDAWIELYALRCGAAGSQVITATWSGSGHKGAAGGSVSLKSPPGLCALGTPVVSTGTGTGATVSIERSSDGSLVLAAVGVSPGASVTSLTFAAPQVQVWSQFGGSAGTSDLTQGALGTSHGAHGTVSVGATLGSSKPWATVAVEALGYAIFVDAEGGTLPSPDWIDVRDHASVQAAIDALPAEGGVVYLPTGTYPISSTIEIPIGKAVHLRGDGPERSIIQLEDDATADLLHIKGSFSTLEKLSLRGMGVASSSEHEGRGVVIGVLEADTPGDIVRRVSILDCRIQDTGSRGLDVIGITDSGASSTCSLSIWGHYERTEILNPRAFGGARLGWGNTTQYFRGCGFVGVHGYGVYAHVAQSLQLVECTFEDSDDSQPYLDFESCSSSGVVRSWFEHHGGHGEARDSNTQRFIVLGQENRNITIEDCHFVRNAAVDPDEESPNDPKLIRIADAGTAAGVAQGVTIRNVNAYVPREPDSSSIDHVAINNGSQVTVEGGSVAYFDENNNLKVRHVQIDDVVETPQKGSLRTAMLNWALRNRLPRTTTTEMTDPPPGLPVWRRGDLVYDASEDRIAYFDGTAWFHLLAEPVE